VGGTEKKSWLGRVWDWWKQNNWLTKAIRATKKSYVEVSEAVEETVQDVGQGLAQVITKGKKGLVKYFVIGVAAYWLIKRIGKK